MIQRFAPLCLLLLLASCSRAASPEAVMIDSRVLADNALGDSPRRRVAVFSPAALPRGMSAPMVVYLPGWGSSSENFLRGGGGFQELVDEFAAAATPIRIAVVDGRSRYGGSQFVNSTATGRYADFVSDEIVGALSAEYPSAAGECWIAGHSSGGYGALRLASDRPEVFSSVVALSPDSDFDTTHKPLVQQPSVQRLTAAEVEAAMAPRDRLRLPQDGLAALVIGLCANYTPITAKPGRFEWLYDQENRWRKDVWQRWIDADPLTLVSRNAGAFRPEQAIYLDGAQYDEFGANIGARKIYEVLRERKSPVTFYEAPGHHADRIPERLARGLRWVFQQHR